MAKHYYENRGDKFLRIFSIALIVFAIIMAFVFFTISGTFIFAYNNLVNLQENVTLAEANLESTMQKRLELIPNLVEIVESHTSQGQTFKEVLNAHETLAEILNSGYSLEKIGEANDNLTTAVNELIAVAESNQEVKEDGNYVEVMNQLQERVTRISEAREEYNMAVHDYNRNINSFPGSLLAPVLGFDEIEYFQADGQESSINSAYLEE